MAGPSDTLRRHPAPIGAPRGTPERTCPGLWWHSQNNPPAPVGDPLSEPHPSRRNSRPLPGCARPAQGRTRNACVFCHPLCRWVMSARPAVAALLAPRRCCVELGGVGQWTLPPKTTHGVLPRDHRQSSNAPVDEGT